MITSTQLLFVKQIEAVNEEKKRLSSDIAELQNRMRDELEIQQLQHFKVNFNHINISFMMLINTGISNIPGSV